MLVLSSSGTRWPKDLGPDAHNYDIVLEVPQIRQWATALGAQGVAVRSVEDLDALARWSARPATERPFLLLDLRISGAVVAPFWEEISQASA